MTGRGPAFAEEQHGLLWFRRSWPTSAGELLASNVASNIARLIRQGRQPQPAAWVSFCSAISISK